jgi:hypothetical protein
MFVKDHLNYVFCNSTYAGPGDSTPRSQGADDFAFFSRNAYYYAEPTGWTMTDGTITARDEDKHGG